MALRDRIECSLMELERLNENNFFRYALKHYDNPQVMDIDELRDDLERIRYLKRLFTTYTNNGEMKDKTLRLILNHMIIFYNVFGVVPSARMLFFKIPRKYHPILKTFMIKLNVFPKNQEDIPEVILIDIPLDINIIKKLREI